MEFNILILMLGLVFSAIFLAAYGLMANWSLKHKVRDRAKYPEIGTAPAILREEKSPGLFKEKILGWLSSSGRWVLRDREKTSRAREDLIHAGFRSDRAPAIYYGLRVLFGFLLPLPCLLLLILQQKVTPLTLLMAFFISVLGFFLPAYLLSIRVRRRQTRIDKALPDVLDLFIICMEAGLSLNATVHRVAREIQGVYKDFYDELQITAAELRTGIPWDEAFDNLGRRTGVQSVRSLVSLMIQSEKMGTSIAASLRTHSEFSRIQRALRAEEKAAKLAVKLIFPLVMLILPAMFIVSVGPTFIYMKTLIRLFKR